MPRLSSPDRKKQIREVATELFARHGVRAVGIDEVIRRAQVAKATLYRHFASKDELVLAFLQQREQLWTRDWVEAEARRRGATAEEHLLAIFDLFDEWFQRVDFEGCSFINVLLEMNDRTTRIGGASAVHLATIRSIIRQLATEASLRDPEQFSHSWHILMKGSIVAAGEGDSEAARRAQAMGRLLIAQHR
jgi:AcrR family transcriptional regulator